MSDEFERFILNYTLSTVLRIGPLAFTTNIPAHDSLKSDMMLTDHIVKSCYTHIVSLLKFNVSLVPNTWQLASYVLLLMLCGLCNELGYM